MPKDKALYSAAFVAVRDFEKMARSHPLFPQTLAQETWEVWETLGNQRRSKRHGRQVHFTFRLFPNKLEDGPHAEATLELARLVADRRQCTQEEALRIAYVLLRRTIYHFPADGDGVLARFEDMYLEFEEDMLAPRGKYIVRMLAPLLNVELTSAEVTLCDGLVIRKCDDQLYRKIQGSESLTKGYAAWFKDRYEDLAECAVTGRFISEDPFPSSSGEWQFERLAVFAKLFRRSAFFLSRIRGFPSFTHQMGGTMSIPPSFTLRDETFSPPGGTLRLSAEEEKAFASAYEKFVAYCPAEPMPLYLRRFAKGCYEANAEDRIVDLMIGFESMVLSDGQGAELSHRFSERVAWLLGKRPVERKEIYQRARDLYGLRSKIAHGGLAKVVDLQAKSDSLEELSRKTICADIEVKASTGKGIDWSNIIFGADMENDSDEASSEGV